MKYLFIIFALLALGLNSQGVFATNYKDNILKVENPITDNTQANIDKAKLLCAHVSNFDKNITDIISKYGLGEDETLTKTLGLVTKMKEACEIIKTNQIERADANSIMTSIVNDLGVLNKGVKEHLKEEIGKIKQEHQRFIKIGNKISYHLDILIKKLQEGVYRDKKVTSRESRVLGHTKNLTQASNTLKGFDKIEFYKRGEMRSSMIRIIKDIRKEIRAIKNS